MRLSGDDKVMGAPSKRTVRNKSQEVRQILLCMRPT
jgi:hypothetical protein